MANAHAYQKEAAEAEAVFESAKAEKEKMEGIANGIKAEKNAIIKENKKKL